MASACAPPLATANPQLTTNKMSLWLIVPVKPFAEGKSRLAPVLTEEARTVASRTFLTHVLDTVQAAGCFDHVVVVSRDQQALTLASHYGAQVLIEQGRSLNAALEQARAYALSQGATSLLVLPADLAFLSAADVVMLCQSQPAEAGVTIARSRDGGTSALLLRPPSALPFRFGADSFARHLYEAQQRGLPVTIIESETLAADVDQPGDWLAWQAVMAAEQP